MSNSKVVSFIKKQPPARIIAFGFAMLIFIGSGLLMSPGIVKHGIKISYLDAFYTATSSVCVTGLVTVDIGDTFTPLGHFVIAMLIQFGGLGVTTVGAGVMLAIGKKLTLKVGL